MQRNTDSEDRTPDTGHRTPGKESRNPDSKDRPFEIVAPFKPTGDQPRAIEELTEGILRGDKYQTLLGATGTGKTFAVSHVIANVGRPTLIMSPNKTLAAQLYGEFTQFFPNNAVEFFISYYDYYQPEAYIVHSDTYIEKDLSINEQIDRPATSCNQHTRLRSPRYHRRCFRFMYLRHWITRGVPGRDRTTQTR